MARAIALFWLLVTFSPAGDMFGPFALFHIGWVPMFAVPNPRDILGWVATAIISSARPWRNLAAQQG